MRKTEILSGLFLLLSRSSYAVPNIFEGEAPTDSPAPSPAPSETPTGLPTTSFPPSISPTHTVQPSLRPSLSPSNLFSKQPTESPAPSPVPTNIPSFAPSNRPSISPSHSPTASKAPSFMPSVTQSPSASPSAYPTLSPTRFFVTMSIPLKITLDHPRLMEAQEVSRFQDIVLQFLKDNLNVTQNDMEVDYTSVTVQTQKKVRGRPQIEITMIVTAAVYDSSQEIDDDFDFRETTERPFDTNMTGLLLMLTASEDESGVNAVNGSSSSSVLEGENRWIGILAICIAIFVLLIVILCVFLYCWRKREVPFGNFGKDIDTESEEDVPVPLHTNSWESDDRFDMNTGLGANNVTVDVHKCNSATCPQCTKANE
ncbi:hypothetical protein MHU86_10434 [Fragilaria crotonensis]|nr:hypothetical protein MHU86_10434 [Fragilaria crotonensis]